MRSSTSLFFVLPLIVGAVLGAASDTARAADPQETQTGTGTIEMGILGATEDVRFFVDGKLVGTRKRTDSSHVARAQVEVPVGEHKAVAYLRTPARGDVGEWIQLSTREPLLVTPGSVTRLEADVSRVGSGKPEDTVRYFQVSPPQPTSGAGFSTAAAGAAPARASVEDTVPPATAGAVAAVPAVPTITIRGTEVLSDGKTAPRLASSAATDRPLEVSLLVQSDPPGAETSLDGKLVGVTPLHVQLDPRLDHVLTVGHVGCESIVQLLAADAWRAGRSQQTLVQLDCK